MLDEQIPGKKERLAAKKRDRRKSDACGSSTISTSEGRYCLVQCRKPMWEGVTILHQLIRVVGDPLPFKRITEPLDGRARIGKIRR